MKNVSSLNKISSKLAEGLEDTEDMFVKAEDLVVEIKETNKELKQILDEDVLAEDIGKQILRTQKILDDYEYIRESVKSTTESVKRVLEGLTEEIVMTVNEKRNGLILAFAELTKTQLESNKLLSNVYRDLSVALLNLKKLLEFNFKNETVNQTNILNIEANQKEFNVNDILERLRGNNENAN